MELSPGLKNEIIAAQSEVSKFQRQIQESQQQYRKLADAISVLEKCGIQEQEILMKIIKNTDNMKRYADGLKSAFTVLENLARKAENEVQALISEREREVAPSKNDSPPD